LSATNQFLRLTIAEDGTLEIDDLQTGDSYRGLHYFEDVEDAGDEYSYSPCARSQTISTCGRLARIELLHSGPCVTTFRVEHHLPLPAGIAPDRQQRSSELVDTTIISEISLYQDVPGVYIVTEMENRSRDHKLTAVFPTSFNPDQVWVDESFAVLARPVDLPVASGWVEDPTPLMHQRAFTDLSQDGRGLAVLNRGLPSIEVHRSGTGIQLALPLLRSVGWLSRGDLSTRRVTAGPVVETPEAQCLGHHRFDYAILPHAGDWREVYPTAYAYVAPLLLSRADTHEGLVLREMNITGDDPAGVKEIPWQRGGPLPESLSFLTLDPPDLVLSAVRRTADGLGLVVRGYSLSPSPVAAHLAVCKPLNSAWRANLNEERMSPLNVTGGNSVELTVRPGEVFTVELRF
jgi:alpha-mannosidase